MKPKVLLSVWIFVFLGTRCFAGVLPAENMQLNYRLVGFSFPPGAYTIEIAVGNYSNLDSFRGSVCISKHVSSKRVVIEVPVFGKKYTWRLVDDSKRSKVDFHHFSVGVVAQVDTSHHRLRVTTPATKFKDAFVFSDMNRALYNLQGAAVWYLPEIPGVNNENSIVRDLKMTEAGTITFLSDDKPFEVDYNGKVLWSAPVHGTISGDSTEHFHHEFTRLKNGNYMVCGNELMPLGWRPAMGPQGPSADNLLIPVGNYSYGTLLEYDKVGNLVWSWKSSGYYKNVDFVDCKTHQPQTDIHENGFFFDETRQFIYVSFKNISQIVKLKYPEGTMVNIFGTLYEPGKPCPADAMFWEQHACRVSSEGQLYFFNNNMNHLDELPKIMVCSEPAGSLYTLINKWEYAYPREFWNKERQPLTSGGNVLELPDGSFFVAMCGPLGNAFIVSSDKKLIWDGSFEQWSEAENKWVLSNHYRCSIVPSVDALEKMIWFAGQ